MEKKIDAWVPSPDDTLDSLIGQQRQVLEDFAEFSGSAFPHLAEIPSIVVEVDQTEVVERSANGSRFFKVVQRLFRKNGNGHGGGIEGTGA
jgi:hypothetical protein